MALFSSFLGCFSDTGRVAAQGDDHIVTASNTTRTSSKLKPSHDIDAGAKSRTVPIPVSYFPIGSRFSHL